MIPALASLLFPAARPIDIPIRMDELLVRAKHQSGHDWRLNEDACAAIRSGAFPLPSPDAFFTADELLAFAVAKADADPTSALTVVPNLTEHEADYRVGVFAMLIGAHCVSRGFGDAEFVFATALRFFVAYAHVDYDRRQDDLLATIHLLRAGRALPHSSP